MATLNNTYPLNSDLIVKNKSVFSKTSKLRQKTPDVCSTTGVKKHFVDYSQHTSQHFAEYLMTSIHVTHRLVYVVV
jgi:hypothetical protein